MIFLVFLFTSVLAQQSVFGEKYSAKLTFDPLPTQVNAGDTIKFSGKLTTDGRPVSNAVIYIKDAITLGFDKIILKLVTDSDGRFTGTWVAVPKNSGSYDFYAVYGGSNNIGKPQTQRHAVTVVSPSDSQGSSDSSSSGLGSSYTQKQSTAIILDNLPSSIKAGQKITFTGRLVSNGQPVPSALVYIMESDPLIPDQRLGYGRTDNNGRFSIDWKVEADYVEIDFDIYANFGGDDHYKKARSPNQVMSVQKYAGYITLDPIPKSAKIGDLITFSGALELNQGSSEGAVVYIKDEDPIDADDLLATAYVDSNGRFFANWFVTSVDLDGVADIYAIFRGNNIYYTLVTCDDHPRMWEHLGSCTNTPKLRIYEAEPPQITSADYSNKEYTNLYYSWSLNQNPKVAIITTFDTYTNDKKYLIPIQEGIITWTSYLQNKYGGDWNVDFDVITPDKLFFSGKPDIVMNMVTPDMESGCNYDFGGYAKVGSNPIRPTQTVVCIGSQGKPTDTSFVSATATHEFAHAMGLGHTWNKRGDLMCSYEDLDGKRVYTCPSAPSKSKTPSDLDLAAMANLYGQDGFKNPNTSVEYKSKFSLTEQNKQTKPTIDKTIDTDRDKIPDYRDRCKTKPETYNDYRDNDGCPDRKPRSKPSQ